MPTLSVCCLTRGPTARVAAQLQLFRELAEEIVVALDASVDDQLAAPLEDVADVLVRYPYAEPVDRPVGWVHSLCTGDWIFWVDDDEIPSAALVRELASIVGSVQVTHCFVPRRTLWRDAATILQGPPWVPDYQLRLVQNDPRLLWFPGITHWPIEALGPHRYLEAPLYHADLLLSPVERRREKVRRYETAVPGRRVAGLPMNDAYFLPEERGRARTAGVAEEDRENVSLLLELDPWPEPRPPRGQIRVASREEIDAHWHGAPAREELYRGRLEIVDELDPFAAGEERGVTVRVRNDGSHVWPPGKLGSPRIRVSYRWLAADGTVFVSDGLRTPLPEALEPGAAMLVPAVVVAPLTAGNHTLAFDLLHEHTRWFGCDVFAAVAVRRAPRIAVLGEDERLAAAAAAALAEQAPSFVPIVLAAEPRDAAERLGYATAPDARPYVLGAGRESRLGVVARAGALLADAALLRARRRVRLAAPAGTAFLEAVRGADALLVVGDDALRGAGGEREAWQRGAALLAAATLGLELVLVAAEGRGGSLAGRLGRAASEVVSPEPGESLESALPAAIALLVERLR